MTALDDVDKHILSILRRDGRATVSDIARLVGLSPAPVSRRIERMERHGVIRGYTALVNEPAAGAVEAFAEIRLGGLTQTSEVAEILRDMPEIEEFYAIAGDPDVLLRLRVDDLNHLLKVLNNIRRTGQVSGTKPLVVMHAWSRISGDLEILALDVPQRGATL